MISRFLAVHQISVQGRAPGYHPCKPTSNHGLLFCLSPSSQFSLPDFTVANRMPSFFSNGLVSASLLVSPSIAPSCMASPVLMATSCLAASLPAGGLAELYDVKDFPCRPGFNKTPAGASAISATSRLLRTSRIREPRDCSRIVPGPWKLRKSFVERSVCDSGSHIS